MHLRHHLAPLAFAVAAATSAAAVANSYGNAASDEPQTSMSTRTEQAQSPRVAPSTSTQASGITPAAAAAFDTQSTVVGRPVGTEPYLNQANRTPNGANTAKEPNTVNATTFDEQETANGQAVGNEPRPLRPLVRGTGRAGANDSHGTTKPDDSYHGTAVNNAPDRIGANDRDANGRVVQPRSPFDNQSTANGRTVGNTLSNDASAGSQWANESLFRSLDTDGNGRLTSNEIMHDRSLERDMNALDRNHDGVLSHDEFSSYKS